MVLPGGVGAQQQQQSSSTTHHLTTSSTTNSVPLPHHHHFLHHPILAHHPQAHLLAHQNTLVHSVNILRSLPMMPTAIADTSSSSHNVSSSALTPVGCAVTSNSASQMISTSQWERTMACQDFTKAQMNDIVLDYLVKEGFKEAAEAFAAEAKIDLQSEKLSGMDERLAIQTCIVSGDIIGAIKSINDLNADLLDENADINFQLKQQHVIELIRGGDKEGALKFAQLYLSEHGEDPSRRQATEKTLMLLCFDDFDSCPVKELLSKTKRQKLAEDVNSAILISQHREASSKLAKAVQILDWAQTSLDDRGVKYPRIDDVTTGELSYPDSASLVTMQ
ncbi:glucose-induced degradation protein 8 homolog [Convolutriloba macropyga]|uniref:glucose-induced degradation protein 8 homolog n=1 Tax=Convolutriloba macropyga TaxID=536237 RepID=UPI003F525031